jgi:hypothetical protein
VEEAPAGRRKGEELDRNDDLGGDERRTVLRDQGDCLFRCG